MESSTGSFITPIASSSKGNPCGGQTPRRRIRPSAEAPGGLYIAAMGKGLRSPFPNPIPRFRHPACASLRKPNPQEILDESDHSQQNQITSVASLRKTDRNHEMPDRFQMKTVIGMVKLRTWVYERKSSWTRGRFMARKPKAALGTSSRIA